MTTQPMSPRVVAGLLLLLALAWTLSAATEPAAPGSERTAAEKAYSAGNFKVAYEAYRKLSLDPRADAKRIGSDLQQAVNSQRELGRVDELDELLDQAAALHKGNWRLLTMAARLYEATEHSGFIIAGKFTRGGHRGGTGQPVYSFERDRVRALQLMEQAAGLVKGDANADEAGTFYRQLAQMLLGNRGYTEAWRLQYLTDLTKLPDYDETYPYQYGYQNQNKGAPVSADGSPVFHHVPKSWEESKSDGERWRWCLVQAMELNPAERDTVRFEFAAFLHAQFGVQTMAYNGRGFNRDEDDGKKNESGPFAVATLGEDETIARLATGIKRFKLPDEFNPIRIYRDMLDNKGGYGSRAGETLAQIFEDRQQYDKAADLWRRIAEQFGSKEDKARWQARLDQIVGNWGRFESMTSQPAGRAAVVDFRFRNGNAVAFEAFEIDIKKLLDDVKAYIQTKPNQITGDQIDIGNIGYRLVEKNQQKYIGGRTAAWDLALKPREGHVDDQVTVQTPLKKAGAYLVTAKMKDGNVSRIVLWVADTVLIKKAMDQKTFCFVADAVTGKPVAKANLEFFGYRQWSIEDKVTHAVSYNIDTENFAESADANGQLIYANKGDQYRYQWLITATTPEGRLAYLGYTNIWNGGHYDPEYNLTKAFLITDRPIYRPEQTVKFKVWVNNAKYDQQGKSPQAGKTFTVRVQDPRGQKFWEKDLTADEYGGVDGELPLEKGAMLGVYTLRVVGVTGGGTFRVEEYKKPEFEVSVEAPNDPVMLGDKVGATIKAKYLFGAPVTEAKVKYKVLRSSYDAAWYPIARWDWFYGRGYWWFACDYTWYPGWSEWGCRRPYFLWYPSWRQPRQPELIAETEVPIGADGTVKFEIDTALAKAIHGDEDHRYEITAEVTDASRRVIVGQGAVLVARKPFKVYAWVDRGHYRLGDVVQASFAAQTLDNKPVKGKGDLRLLRVSYDKDAKPIEKEVQRWDLGTDDQGRAALQIKAAQGGQYRLSYKVADAAGHMIEGGYVFTVAAGDPNEQLDGQGFRFNDIELVTDKREYQPGEKVNLQINANRADATVLLFVRPANGVYLPPKMIELKGKSALEAVEIIQKDMPNFFVEALTIGDCKVFSETREIVVPPVSRVLNVEVTPSAERYKPGEKAKVKVRLTDPAGEPFVGTTVVSIYDKAVEYISGGSNVPEIREYFWKWRRQHYPRTESSLDKAGNNQLKTGEAAMTTLGVFGDMTGNQVFFGAGGMGGSSRSGRRGAIAHSFMEGESGSEDEAMSLGMAAGGPASDMKAIRGREELAMDKSKLETGAAPPPDASVEPTVRSNFADTALWVASLTTNQNGEAEVDLTMPESLTTWKAKVWAMGSGTQVGQGQAEVITSKNLLVRMQAPRFFVEKDEVVLSANVHNYLKARKKVQVVLEIPMALLMPTGDFDIRSSDGIARLGQDVEIDPNGEKRVDWRVKVSGEGTATIRMKALTDEESDAMEMKFPVYVHGMLKTDSFSGVIRPDKDTASITIKAPAERRPEQSRLELRYSPTLAGAMVDALPYLVDYPYGCTEQTLNRFLPTVVTQHTLLKMGLDLKDIQKKRTNLNAQEIGDDVKRAEDWKRMKHAQNHEDNNPVFDEAVVQDMVKAGVNRLTSMQCSDGGWGWFSGMSEQSYPHTTAVVVHGLQVARENDVALVPGVLERGVEWLKRYQTEQVRLLKNAADKENHPNDWKQAADNIDALVYMVLVDANVNDQAMQDFLYRDRTGLAVYAKSMLGLALNRLKVNDRRDMIIQNIEQFLVQDDENQSAYLKLPGDNAWWCWYGSEYEAQAYYLKLLAVTDPKGQKASRLVKYLVNNRRNATYWNSTRDTAIVVEAFADYIKASGEDKPDMTVEILLDGKKVKEVKIDKENLFSFDNKLVLEGDKVTTGEHKVELRRAGRGSVYFNAYLTNFTLEDPIAKAGLEIKVNRKYYKLTRVDKSVKAQGAQGQAVDQKVEKYQRELIPGPFDDVRGRFAPLKSGDLVEIELEIDSKNDYEYIVFEDMKAAGFEPVEVRSGYNGNTLGAYMELRNERVTFFCRSLPRGKHSVSFRVRAEVPGLFSALPTKARAMYAPELKANSDEMKIRITD